MRITSLPHGSWPKGDPSGIETTCSTSSEDLRPAMRTELTYSIESSPTEQHLLRPLSLWLVESRILDRENLPHEYGIGLKEHAVVRNNGRYC